LWRIWISLPRLRGSEAFSPKASMNWSSSANFAAAAPEHPLSHMSFSFVSFARAPLGAKIVYILSQKKAS
jgi:hypothetical protein